MNANTQNSKGWILYTYVSFAVALGAMVIGTWMSELSLPMKGFLTMGTLFLTGSTFTLAKTIRDEHEAKLLHNRIDEARTEKLLREVEPAAA